MFLLFPLLDFYFSTPYILFFYAHKSMFITCELMFKAYEHVFMTYELMFTTYEHRFLRQELKIL